MSLSDGLSYFEDSDFNIKTSVMSPAFLLSLEQPKHEQSCFGIPTRAHHLLQLWQHNILPLCQHIIMQTAILSLSKQHIASGVLSGLIYRESRAWQLRGTGSDVCPTNESALLYVLNLNKFRLCDVDNIVVLGLRDLGTVEQQAANYAGQGPMTDQRLTQNGAIKQLGVAQIIQGHIRTYLRNGAPVNLHVCDENFTDSIKSILGELGVTVIGWSDLSRYVNQHSLVYDLTMEGGWLQRAVNFSWQGNATPPAAVITHMRNGM